MATEVILPRIDPGMTEGTIRQWKTKEGDRVEKGEVLYILETEKVTFEVEAPESGILAKVMGKAGDVVAIGKVVAFILQPGEEVPEIPAEEKIETKEGVAPAAQPRQVEKSEPAKETVAIRATPLAKRIAKEHNIDLSLIKGTGPEGRIIKEDVMQAIEGVDKADVAPTVQEEVLPLSSMRATIARRMTESFQSAPHFYLLVEVDAKELRRAREKLMPSIEKLTGLSLTYTDLLLKITAQALGEHPEINVTWASDGIKRLRDVNVGLAIAVEDGLIVPVIQQANTKSLAEITSIRGDFVQRAAKGKIRMDEMRGGSLTVTNLGMFGIDQFCAIINPPESCILAIGCIVDKPVVDNGQVVIRPRMNLTLSIDHRVLDGVTGGRFLQRIKELIELPIPLNLS
jgi:pyruvate dehydrogenase E2 component (dihydrolipoamide acetyltransferase)